MNCTSSRWFTLLNSGGALCAGVGFAQLGHGRVIFGSALTAGGLAASAAYWVPTWRALKAGPRLRAWLAWLRACAGLEVRLWWLVVTGRGNREAPQSLIDAYTRRVAAELIKQEAADQDGGRGGKENE